MSPRLAFRISSALAAVSGVLFVLTLLRPAWIEAIFGVDPDGGSGALEWAIVGGLLFITFASTRVARAARARLVAAASSDGG